VAAAVLVALLVDNHCTERSLFVGAAVLVVLLQPLLLGKLHSQTGPVNNYIKN
jgi:hypothetical protein